MDQKHYSDWYDDYVQKDIFWAAISLALPFLLAASCWIIYQGTSKSLSAAGLTFVSEIIFAIPFITNLVKRERHLARLEVDGLNLPSWRKNKQQLLRDGYEEIGMHKGYEILRQYEAEHSTDPSTQEFVIQAASRTVANAFAIRVYDEGSWVSGRDDLLEARDKAFNIASVFENPDLRTRLKKLQRGNSDIICIGLVSSDGEAGQLDNGVLSERRGMNLGSALLEHSQVNRHKSTFRSVGLGASTQEVTSPREAKVQRSALVIGIVRELTAKNISFEDSISCIIAHTGLGLQHLSDFEFSNEASARLRNSNVDFRGQIL